MRYMDAKTSVPVAVNEPIKTYAPGTSEREELQAKLAEFYAADPVEITGTFGDERRPGRGEDRLEVTMPSEHAHVLGVVQQAPAGFDDGQHGRMARVAAAAHAAPRQVGQAGGAGRLAGGIQQGQQLGRAQRAGVRRGQFQRQRQEIGRAHV